MTKCVISLKGKQSIKIFANYVKTNAPICFIKHCTKLTSKVNIVRNKINIQIQKMAQEVNRYYERNSIGYLLIGISNQIS